MRELRQAFVATLLTFGVAVGSAANAAGSNCALVLIEEWPVRQLRNHVVVDGAINGGAVGIMIDTGAERSLILRSAAVRLHLLRSELRGYRMFGLGGESAVETALVEQLRIGKSARSGMRLLVAGEQDFGEGVAVILGEDFFHAVDVEFDLAHNTLRLFQASDCGDRPLAYWTNDIAGQVDFELLDAARPRILLPVKINGQPIRAQLDSGAAASILTLRAAAEVGLTPSTPGVVYGGRGAGIGAKPVDVWIGELQSFAIGNETIENTSIRFGDLFNDARYALAGSHVLRSVAQHEMLLGADFLGAHRVLIAHSQHKLYFTYEGRPVFQPRYAPGRP
jgi:predicted aspartyl protease